MIGLRVRPYELMMELAKGARQTSANRRLQRNHAGHGAHRSARCSYHNLEVLLRNLFMPATVGVTATTIQIQLW